MARANSWAPPAHHPHRPSRPKTVLPRLLPPTISSFLTATSHDPPAPQSPPPPPPRGSTCHPRHLAATTCRARLPYVNVAGSPCPPSSSHTHSLWNAFESISGEADLLCRFLLRPLLSISPIVPFPLAFSVNAVPLLLCHTLPPTLLCLCHAMHRSSPLVPHPSLPACALAITARGCHLLSCSCISNTRAVLTKKCDHGTHRPAGGHDSEKVESECHQSFESQDRYARPCTIHDVCGCWFLII